MEVERLTLARKFLLWFLRYPPYSPYVSASFSADFSAGLAYLERLNEGDAERVTIQHLVTGAVGRVYAEFPIANATVSGSSILSHRRVGAVMPVNLLGSGGGADGHQDTGLLLVEDAQRLSLRELARTTRRQVDAERAGRTVQPLLRALIPVAERLPFFVVRGLLSAAELAVRLPAVAKRLHRAFPMTVVVSNVGAAVPLPPGAVTRGVAFSPPNRGVSIGSIFGIFPMQDEVVALDGRPVVRPALPMTYMWDHRLFDGVLAGRILTRLAEVMGDPAGTFGADGDRRGPEAVARPGAGHTRGARHARR